VGCDVKRKMPNVARCKNAWQTNTNARSREEFDGCKRSVVVNRRVKSDRTYVIKVTRTAQGTQQSGMPEGNLFL